MFQNSGSTPARVAPHLLNGRAPCFPRTNRPYWFLLVSLLPFPFWWFFAQHCSAATLRCLCQLLFSQLHQFLAQGLGARRQAANSFDSAFGGYPFQVGKLQCVGPPLIPYPHTTKLTALKVFCFGKWTPKEKSRSVVLWKIFPLLGT